ncbi:hypothetical protein LINPERHAP1_LOCUS6220 [Linum perenne]
MVFFKQGPKVKSSCTECVNGLIDSFYLCHFKAKKNTQDYLLLYTFHHYLSLVKELTSQIKASTSYVRPYCVSANPELSVLWVNI